LIVYSSKKVQSDMDDSKAPLMGVLGAFVFAAQMINFSIPGTGSSGHLGGALLLSILLGKHAAFLTISSILAIQALLFADGGLLALGGNIFNLGFFPCFIAYPLIYRPIAAGNPAKVKLIAGICLAAMAGLQMGAFGVVLETQLSGIAEIPFMPFLLLMQPVHLVIGLVEGLVTAATVLFVLEARPDMRLLVAGISQRTVSVRGLLVGFLLLAFLTGGALSWFASSDPDGLEWSIAKVSGKEEMAEREGLHAMLANFQRKIAFLPGYNLLERQPSSANQATGDKPAEWPAIDGGQSVACVIGVLITLLAAGAIGKLLKLVARRT
jgi:cobalt/nickel transport system permease protein